MQELITFQEAIERITQTKISPIGKEYVPLSESSGRILAEEITAPSDNPLLPTAAMDGYAIRGEDMPLGKLQILGDNPAGSMPTQSVTPGTCIKTFTGSIMPEGSDTLILIENVTAVQDKLLINDPVQPGDHVRQSGENFKKGGHLLSSPLPISPPVIGLLASVNKVQIPVYTQPTVGIISFGSELKDLGEELENPAQIRSINHHMITSAAQAFGANVRHFGIIQDTPEESRRMIKTALAQVDLLVTTGGMSMGDYDFIKAILSDLGLRQVFSGVKIKPGKPVAYYAGEKKHILGLPGYPNSSFATFLLFGRMIISALKGYPAALPLLPILLDQDIRKKPGRMEFRPCRYRMESDGIHIDFHHQRGTSSAIVNNLCCHNLAYVLLDADKGDFTSDDTLFILPVTGDFGILS